MALRVVRGLLKDQEIEEKVPDGKSAGERRKAGKARKITDAVVGSKDEYDDGSEFDDGFGSDDYEDGIDGEGFDEPASNSASTTKAKEENKRAVDDKEAYDDDEGFSDEGFSNDEEFSDDKDEHEATNVAKAKDKIPVPPLKIEVLKSSSKRPQHLSIRLAEAQKLQEKTRTYLQPHTIGQNILVERFKNRLEERSWIAPEKLWLGNFSAEVRESMVEKREKTYFEKMRTLGYFGQMNSVISRQKQAQAAEKAARFLHFDAVRQDSDGMWPNEYPGVLQRSYQQNCPPLPQGKCCQTPPRRSTWCGARLNQWVR